VRTFPPVVPRRVGNFRPGIDCWGREAMVKVYGVAMAIPQG
jgi:hypothetical protein